MLSRKTVEMIVTWIANTTELKTQSAHSRERTVKEENTPVYSLIQHSVPVWTDTGDATTDHSLCTCVSSRRLQVEAASPFLSRVS